MSITSKERAKRIHKLITNYDYEAAFTIPTNTISEIFREDVSNAEAYKHQYVCKKIDAGNQREIDIFPGILASVKFPNHLKSEKKKKDDKKKKEENTRQLYKYIERLVHANYKEGDYNLTFTFAPGNKPKDENETKKEFSKFIANLNRKRKRRGLPRIKYIAFFEIGWKNKDWHIHVIMDNLLDFDTVKKTWNKGHVDFDTLSYSKSNQGERNFVPLCRYLMKHKDNYPRYYKNKDWEIIWSRSRGNLVEPKIKQQKTPIAKKAVKAMSKGDKTDQLNEARKIFEKKYPNYELVDIDVKLDRAYSGLTYISVRMQKRSGSNSKNKRVRI